MRDYQRIFTPDMFQPSLETDPLAPAFDYDREREAVVNRIVAGMAAGRAHAARMAAEREQSYAAARAELEASSNGEAQTSPSGDDGSAANAQAAADAEASAGADAARIEREAAEKEYWQALDQQDSDYHAFMIDLSVRIDGAALDGEQLGEECDLTLWELTQDKLDNLAMVADLKDAIIKAIEPWVSHYRSLGLIRADFGAFGLDASRGEGMHWPRFYLVCRADDADLSPTELANFAPQRIELSSPLGASLTIQADMVVTNATLLFEAMQRGGDGVGQWGGEATTSFAPKFDEGRDQWLERVSLPRDTLGRAVERWVACGRDPYLFARFGDWTERASGSDKIEWVVDGIIPRGEVMLLAGASGAGKSSVAHSWLSALGANADNRTRHVLGCPVTGRYICCLVAGEEGAGSINYREMKHAAAWGSSRYLVLDDPDKSLVDHIDSLHTLPNLDLVVIDTVGAFFDGDEKSSRAVREFMAPLVKLARVKNCAVVLVHHLTKFGEGVKSVAGLKAHVLGAGAFVSTCRLAVGVIRIAGDKLEVGPFKSNIPPELLWLPVGSGGQYLLNDQVYTLDPIREKATAGSLDAEVMDFICDTISEQNRVGRVVRRTGRHEIWERKLPELDGISRVALRDAIAELIGADRILDGPDGLVAVFPTLGAFEEAEL
ncbi:MAG: AAA family ATPase [Novosphingobium sp.]